MRETVELYKELFKIIITTQKDFGLLLPSETGKREDPIREEPTRW